MMKPPEYCPFHRNKTLKTTQANKRTSPPIIPTIKRVSRGHSDQEINSSDQDSRASSEVDTIRDELPVAVIAIAERT